MVYESTSYKETLSQEITLHIQANASTLPCVRVPRPVPVPAGHRTCHIPDFPCPLPHRANLHPLPSALAPPGSEQQPQATARGPTGTTCFPRTAAPAPHGLCEPWRLPGAAPKHPAPTVPPSAAPLGLLTKPTHHHSANKNRRESSDGYSERFNAQQDGGR